MWSLALTVLELLAFNNQKFRGLRGYMLVKFEVRSFNRFKLVW